MLDLESILEMWKKDSHIDENNLDTSSINTAIAHSKYLELYGISKLRLKKLNLEYDVLLRDKFLHYGGKLSEIELLDLGWDPDPLNGLTVLKGDMERFYQSDSVIQHHQQKISYQTEVVATLKEILDTIRFRSNTIKNILEWKKFVSGD